MLIYSYPANDGSKLKAYSYPYIYPYFHQSWAMFAPAPNSNFNVYIRDREHDWEDVFSETINAHQSNRLGGNENLFLSLSTAVRYYASSVEENSFVKVDNGSNPKLRVLEKILVSYMICKYGKRPEKMETIIKIQEINSGKVYAHYYKN